MPIFLKVNHQLESRIQEIWQSGSEGGAKPTFVPTPIATQKNRPVGYGVIRAGVRTDSMIWSDDGYRSAEWNDP